jgi:hypothetical protein
LIEAYINEVVKQMNIICDTESVEISTKDKLEFFTNTRQSFGRTALLLSGGATFGICELYGLNYFGYLIENIENELFYFFF